jgi:hypothetical protein
MSANPPRPPVRIRFKYNVDTGEIEELLIDDNAPDRSEAYHDKVAGAIASYLARRRDIEDAGSRHLPAEQERAGGTDREDEGRRDEGKEAPME